MRYLAREFLANVKSYGLRPAAETAVWNARFNLGYWIGGFTYARR